MLASGIEKGDIVKVLFQSKHTAGVTEAEWNTASEYVVDYSTETNLAGTLCVYTATPGDMAHTSATGWFLNCLSGELVCKGITDNYVWIGVKGKVYCGGGTLLTVPFNGTPVFVADKDNNTVIDMGGLIVNTTYDDYGGLNILGEDGNMYHLTISADGVLSAVKNT